MQQWLDRFAELRAAVAALDAESKASLGAGYSVRFRGAAHFQSHPRANRVARELGIAGVDRKFIENNRTVLIEWLDCLLPAEAMDATGRGLADHGFERRYGLRFEDPQIRFRWLDPLRARGGINDATMSCQYLERR